MIPYWDFLDFGFAFYRERHGHLRQRSQIITGARCDGKENMATTVDFDEDSAASIETPFDENGSGLDDNGPNTKNEHELERNTLAQKENKAVFWARFIVIVVLVTTSVAVTLVVNKKMRASQQNTFETAFESDSLKVLDSFHQSIGRMLDSGDALSIAYTSHALSSNSTFPNVTLPNYHIHTCNMRIMSEAVVFNYQPIVTDETRKGYEAYAIENRGHFFDTVAKEMASIQYQDAYFNSTINRNLQDEPVFADEIYNVIPDGSNAPEGSGPYLPIWQTSPAAPFAGAVNLNILTFPASTTYRQTMYDDKAVILAASSLVVEDTDDYFKTILSMSQFRSTVDEYLGEPTSPFSYPVFDTFDLKTRSVVGLITSTFYWRLYLENILPKNHNGIVCVLSNTFNQTFTYRIDGSKATYLGVGDLHDPKYDYLEVTGDMESYLKSRASPKTQSYTVVSLNTAFNSYKLRIYASQDAEDEQITNEPAIMAVIIVCVFLFTSFVFFTYDLLVARRQRVVMNRAVASSAIVSSLFPSEVRENIYKENEKAQNKKSAGFGSNILLGGSNGDLDENIDLKTSPPNAVLYEETTILFADMVGFTAWSSTRGPVDVFGLLESVYQAFDTIAQRRKVFKVETVGDCYVAVTGVPNPQPEHVVIMVRFAEECIVKMGQVTSKLAATMGPDTADLSIRVGLHSGTVTGGVLRGHKSRFQLFGDSMNTAARMESHGVAGQIHISEDTAKALMAKGKSHWVAPREDQVNVKGKGLLNTFWVVNRKDRAFARAESSAGHTDDDDDDDVVNYEGMDQKAGETKPQLGFTFEI
jgi:class 3 adenylate cyclase